MKIWQADFYRRPLHDENGQVLWELLICDENRQFTYEAYCPQFEANASWLTSQLQLATVNQQPDVIQVFRPQSLSLIELAARSLGILVEPTRRTFALKQWLRSRSYPSIEPYDPIALEQPPPTPLPENLWGQQWRFAALNAGDLADFSQRPIPILHMPEFLLPINLGLASTISVPGVVIDGARKSLQLARWLQNARPVALDYVSGSPSGLVLSAGLVERWIVATFDDDEVNTAAINYTQRKQISKGLHFLLVQPDDSGMTYSGFWFLGDI